MYKKLVVIIILLISFGIVVTGMYTKSESTKVELLLFGTIEAQEVQIGSKIGGRVIEVLAQEGQIVKKGTPLVRFDNDTLLAEKKQLQAKIDQAEAYLKKLENGYRTEEIAQAQATVNRELAQLEALKNGPRPQEISQLKEEIIGVKAELNHYKTSLARLEQLFKEGYVSKQSCDDMAAKVALSDSRYQSLQQKLDLLEAGTRSEDIRVGQERYQQAIANLKLLKSGARSEDILEAKARLAEANATLEKLNTQLNEAEVIAPVDSQIDLLSVRVGDLVQATSPIARLLESDQIRVRVYVPEPDLGFVQVGQEVEVFVDSFPNKAFLGKVEQISAKAEFTPRNVQNRDERSHQVFAIKIHIDNKEGLLKAGMAADVKLKPKE
ncbi:MAG: efflux RND transporter periplasmic adaptor subunit [Blastocatellia bacterium]|nr:efflux RND transporter periplasmic adaptor subunit [Blastocatellia bacterium]MBL8192779.1 efflux RND transporter periplasmic adaptor subunit [Blastocatellia bacterium]